MINRSRSLIHLLKNTSKKPVQIYNLPKLKTTNKESALESSSPKGFQPFNLLGPTTKRLSFFLQTNTKLLHFNTSDRISLYYKLGPHQMHTKAALKQLAFQGFGWAGQPTVERVYAIYPEVAGDTCDVVIPTEEPVVSTANVNDGNINISETDVDNKVNDELQIQPLVLNEKEEVILLNEINSDLPSESIQHETINKKEDVTLENEIESNLPSIPLQHEITNKKGEVALLKEIKSDLPLEVLQHKTINANEELTLLIAIKPDLTSESVQHDKTMNKNEELQLLIKIKADFPSESVEHSKKIENHETNGSLEFAEPRVNKEIEEVKVFNGVQYVHPSGSSSLPTRFKNCTRNCDAIHEQSNDLYRPHIVMKNSKRKPKKKKKTIILDSNPKLAPNSTTLKLNKKTKLPKGALPKNKGKVKTPHILNQNRNTEVFTPDNQNVLLMESRQLQTYSSVNARKTSSLVEKTGIERKKISKSNEAEDDCLCPELDNKVTKYDTKICGSASTEDIEELKKKKFKPKMCLVTKPKLKKRHTKVCVSKKQERAMRKKSQKRELPKCPKPIKKYVPKVTVCPPKLTDEVKEKLKKKEKECVRVEEVKVRKITKVCKPRISYGEEEQIEKQKTKSKKTECVAKVKKIPSRHSKICFPIDEKNAKEKLKQ